MKHICHLGCKKNSADNILETTNQMGLSLTFIDYPFYVASENSNTIFSDPKLFYVRVRCSFKLPVKSKPSLPLMSTLDPSVGLVIPRPIADATIPVPSGNLTRRQPRFQQVHDRIIYQWWMFKHFKPCVFWFLFWKKYMFYLPHTMMICSIWVCLKMGYTPNDS